MILLLTSPHDAHTDYVETKLRARGCSFVRFDPAVFPQAAEISLSYSSAGRCRYVLRAGDEHVDLNDLSMVWYRRPGRPTAHTDLGESLAGQFVEQECSTFVQALWNAMECPWLPAQPAVVKRAGLKASQLRVAGELGFELPPTLITNSRADLLGFYAQHNGNVVSKMAANAMQATMGSTFCRFTEVVSKRDIAHAQAISYCPMIFQAYVPKHVELRITVVGRKVFAAEIHSQQTNHTQVDWRRYDFYNTPYLPHDLPREVERRCIDLVEKLGLRYGAIDMVLTPDGRYVFIEINPNGQYLWVEHETGLPISDAICELLTSGSANNASLKHERETMTGGVM